MAIQPIVQGRGATPSVPPVATMEGVVVRAGSNEPVARATVTVMREAARSASIDDADNPTAPAAVARGTTSDKGVFTLRVPPGRYTISAAKDGFLSSDYGAQGANALGLVVTVSTDRKTDGIVIRLVPAGERVIHGVISNPLGEPQAGVSVQAYRLRYTWNGRRLARVQTVLTNDLGEYRFFGLKPGQYYVAADLSRQAQRLAATGGVSLTPNLSDPDEGFATFYFPDATNPSGGQPVRVGPGVDFGSVNIALKDTPRFVVRGRVIVPPYAVGSQPVELSISPAEILLDANSTPKIYPGAAGEFEFKAAPGYYVLVAQVQAGDQHYSSNPVQIAVADRNLENVTVPLFPNVNVSGRVIIDAARFGADPSGSEVALVNLNGNGETTQRALVASRDGAFNLRDIPSGDYVVLATLPGYYVKSISFGARDVSSEPVRIGANSANARMDIVLSSAGGSVEGRVLGVSGDPAAAQIILVPEERFQRRQDRYLLASTDRTGHFEINGIASGNYTAFAFDEIEPGAWFDPSFTRRFAGGGVAVRAEANNRATVELKMITDSNRP